MVAESAIIALLAVAHWSLERVYALREGLRAAGLFELPVVADLPIEEVSRRLNVAGYARGEYINTLMALRILAMASVLSEARLAQMSEDLLAGRRDRVNALLKGIHGVGPAVLRSFWILQADSQD